MEKITFRSLSLALVSLVPYQIKLAVKKSTVLMPLLRSSLNFFLGLSNNVSVVVIDGGLLKGYQMGLNLQMEKAYWFGVWEARLQEFFKDIIEPGMVIYDIGGHIGFFSLLFSKYAGDNGKVFTFEPDNDMFSRLKQNMTLNNIQNVTLVQLAISNKKGIALFDKTEIDSMGHLVNTDSDGQGLEKVPTDTLDNLVNFEKYPLPDMMKIDVEGSEGKVLAGMEQLLQKKRPMIICELHNYEVAQEFFNILAPHHYQFFKIEESLLYLKDLTGYTGICHVFAKPI